MVSVEYLANAKSAQKPKEKTIDLCAMSRSNRYNAEVLLHLVLSHCNTEHELFRYIHDVPVLYAMLMKCRILCQRTNKLHDGCKYLYNVFIDSFSILFGACEDSTMPRFFCFCWDLVRMLTALKNHRRT